MKRQKNPVFITYINPKGIYNRQGVRLDTIGVATVLKENGNVSHGLSIKSILDPMNRRKGSDMAIGRAYSNASCAEYPAGDMAVQNHMEQNHDLLKMLHKTFVSAVQDDPLNFIQLQAVRKKEHPVNVNTSAQKTL